MNIRTKVAIVIVKNGWVTGLVDNCLHEFDFYEHAEAFCDKHNKDLKYTNDKGKILPAPKDYTIARIID